MRSLTAEELRYIVKSGRLPAEYVPKLLKAKIGETVEIEFDGLRLRATSIPLCAPPRKRRRWWRFWE